MFSKKYDRFIINKGLLVFFVFITFFKTGFSQTGLIDAVFTDQSGKTIDFHISEPVYNANSTDCYWFTQKNTGKRRFSISPARGYGDNKTTFQVPFIELYLNPSENDLDTYQYSYHESKNEFSFVTEMMTYFSPKYDYSNAVNNHPLHIHLNRFTDTEIDFDFNGVVSYASRNTTNANVNFGKLGGHLHLYRKPGYYGITDKTPGCNCDPTIYLWEYDRAENSDRSASACEVVFKKRLYQEMQQFFKPAYQLDYGGKSKLNTGELSVNPCTRCINTNRVDTSCTRINRQFTGV